ncbi:MAG: hypothetical protein R6U98_20100 [Pirellulaceae bacterium]
MPRSRQWPISEEGLAQHTFEGGVIIVVIEQTADATIRHMEDHSTGSNT